MRLTRNELCNCSDCVFKRGGAYACSTCENNQMTKEEVIGHKQAHFVYGEGARICLM